MNRINDYATLVAAIQDLVDLEVGSSVDAYIQLTEQDLNRRLDSLWQEINLTVPVTRVGSLFADDRRGIYRVRIDDTPLERLHIDVARTTYLNWTPQQPLAYSITGGTDVQENSQHLQFWPPPPDDETYQAEVAFKYTIPALTATNTKNWLLSVAPDLYLYGAAVHAVTYNGDVSNFQMYDTLYARGVSGMMTDIERHQKLQRSVSAPGAGGYERYLP